MTVNSELSIGLLRNGRKILISLDIPSLTRKAELEDRHVLFMEDGGNAYLMKLFAEIAA